MKITETYHPQYPVYNKKLQENVIYNQEKKESIYTEHKMTQMLELVDKDYKAATINMSKNLNNEERKMSSNK